jgi:hypothetical protein
MNGDRAKRVKLDTWNERGIPKEREEDKFLFQCGISVVVDTVHERRFDLGDGEVRW